MPWVPLRPCPCRRKCDYPRNTFSVRPGIEPGSIEQLPISQLKLYRDSHQGRQRMWWLCIAASLILYALAMRIEIKFSLEILVTQIAQQKIPKNESGSVDDEKCSMRIPPPLARQSPNHPIPMLILTRKPRAGETSIDLLKKITIDVGAWHRLPEE